LGGVAKKSESLKQILQARRYLKKRYGKIYVEFNEAFSLKEYLSGKDPSSQLTHHELAFHLVQAINDVSLVIPLSLIATAILANHRQGFNRFELTETVELFFNFLKRQGVPMTKNLHEPKKAVKDTLSLLINWKVIESLDDTPGQEEPFHYVDEDKKMELEYYKNSIIHFFIPHAFVALSLLSGKEDVRQKDAVVSDYAFLKNLFKHEFVFDENEDLEKKIDTVTAYFLETAFITTSENGRGYKITKLGYDKLPIWAALAKTFIESYWIVVKFMTGRTEQRGKKDELLKEMHYLGRRFHKLGVVEHVGALSQLNYKNAMKFINEDLLKTSNHSGDPSTADDRLSQLGQRLYELSHYRS